MNNIVRLGKPDVKRAAGVLASAFHDYPLLQYSFPDMTERTRMVPYYCQTVLYYGIKYGEVYATSPAMEGVAAWITSDHFPMTFWRILRSVPLSVLTSFGRGGASRMDYPGGYIDAMHRRYAPFRHWFLLQIGVTPQMQGKGYAGKLMRPMLERMDADGLPCYTETMDQKNVTLYEHLGFRVMERLEIPRTDLTTWALLRDAAYRRQ
ncbi:MAG: GNAT family N-acetyltransferase [Dehalococcoidia bacterium]